MNHEQKKLDEIDCREWYNQKTFGSLVRVSDVQKEGDLWQSVHSDYQYGS